MEAYRVGEGTAKELRGRFDTLVEGRPYAGDMGVDIRLLRERRTDVALSAQALVMPLDAMLAKFRFNLFGDYRCKDDGPELRNGVTVDRALDAVGNYARHEYEWFAHDRKDTWPEGQQKRSITPLAKLHTSCPIEDNRDAYMEFTSIEIPAAFVLDLIGNYETDGPDMTYRTVESKVYAAALKSIERRFPKAAGSGY
jgi:hypothetical protein